VKRSGTLGRGRALDKPAQRAADLYCVGASIAVARFAGLRTHRSPPRVPLRFTLGYMPPPATQARYVNGFQVLDLITPGAQRVDELGLTLIDALC
jgi:hypothetical protein